jgi:hypothetical protein
MKGGQILTFALGVTLGLAFWEMFGKSAIEGFAKK